MTNPRQALLKRSASYTREKFSTHWLKHGSKVTPWALDNGVTYYAQVRIPTIREASHTAAVSLMSVICVQVTVGIHRLTVSLQIHNPRVAHGVTVPSNFNISGWDGAAEMAFERGPDFKSTAKSDDYYQNVILPDERTFLVCEALQHLQWMDPGAIVGDKIVFLQGGKALIDCEEDMKIWNNWLVK